MVLFWVGIDLFHLLGGLEEHDGGHLRLSKLSRWYHIFVSVPFRCLSLHTSWKCSRPISVSTFVCTRKPVRVSKSIRRQNVGRPVHVQEGLFVQHSGGEQANEA